MLHIKPIPEEKASDQVKELYTDIKEIFDVEIVPLFFQYLANFEEYFVYSWEKMKQNIESPVFGEFYDEVVKFSHEAVREIYTPSVAMSQFVSSLDSQEKKNIAGTILSIEKANVKLFLLTLGLREGLKGVMIGQQLLSAYAGEDVIDYEGIFDEYINAKEVRQDLLNKKDELESASRMLAPLFGSQSLTVSNYPAFFSKVAQEMERLIATENYLTQRVILEHIGLLSVSQFPYSLGCSYQEIAKFAWKRPHFSELIYIMSETFPSTLPRLVLTTALMDYVLNYSKILQQ